MYKRILICSKDNRAIFQKAQKSFNHFEIGLKCIIKCRQFINEVEMCRNILVSDIGGVQKRVFCKKNKMKKCLNAFLNTVTIVHRSFLLSMIFYVCWFSLIV